MSVTTKDAKSSDAITEMMESAETASNFVKALANHNRLLLLCLLAEGEKSVSDLKSILDLRQPTISQQLSRLRADDLVIGRRDGKTIYYSLASNEARQFVELLYELFCAPDAVKAKVTRRLEQTAAE